MRPSTSNTLLAVLSTLSLSSLVSAQVTTDCDPTKKDCPNDPALSAEVSFDFLTSLEPIAWEEKVRGVELDSTNGATFSIKKQGDAPTLRSKFYIFGGRTEIQMKCAHGQGVISSVMFLSDTLDEVDWEMYGSKTNIASTNYFSKGVEDYTHGEYHDVGKNLQDDFHNYTTVWTKDKFEWWVDGENVRTLLANEGNSTETFPQTPMRIHLGVWAGGDPRLPEDTRKWAGGDTDYDAGPYTMQVKSIIVEDFSQNAKEYEFGDRSGSWDSIKIIEGNSTVKDEIFAPPKLSASEKWKALPSGTKAGIYAGVGGVAAVFAGALGFYCYRQRKAGQMESMGEKGSFEPVQTAPVNDVQPRTNNMAYDSFEMNGPSSPDTAYHGAAGLAAGSAAFGASSTSLNPFRDPSRPTTPATISNTSLHSQTPSPRPVSQGRQSSSGYTPVGNAL